MSRRPSEETLQAYYDGELGWLARKRAERQIAASPEAQEELRGLALVSELVRESEPVATGPDLWSEIALALPRHPVAVEDPGTTFADVLSWIFRPAGAAVATVAAAAAAFYLMSGGEPAGVADVVQYLDPGDNSVMLLQGEDDATIIWIMEPVATDTSSREIRAFI